MFFLIFLARRHCCPQVICPKRQSGRPGRRPPRASQRPPCRQGSRLHDAPFRLPFPGCQERCCSVCAGGGGVLQGRAKGPPPVKPKQGPKAPVLWALCAPAAPRRNAPRPANHTASRPKNGRLASACRKTLGGSGAAMQFAKVALRRPVGPSWRSLAHWASASLLPPLAALGFALRRL